jgi:hypothetical protein
MQAMSEVEIVGIMQYELETPGVWSQGEALVDFVGKLFTIQLRVVIQPVRKTHGLWLAQVEDYNKSSPRQKV